MKPVTALTTSLVTAAALAFGSAAFAQEEATPATPTFTEEQKAENGERFGICTADAMIQGGARSAQAILSGAPVSSDLMQALEDMNGSCLGYATGLSADQLPALPVFDMSTVTSMADMIAQQEAYNKQAAEYDATVDSMLGQDATVNAMKGRLDQFLSGMQTALETKSAALAAADDNNIEVNSQQVGVCLVDAGIGLSREAVQSSGADYSPTVYVQAESMQEAIQVAIFQDLRSCFSAATGIAEADMPAEPQSQAQANSYLAFLSEHVNLDAVLKTIPDLLANSTVESAAKMEIAPGQPTLQF